MTLDFDYSKLAEDREGVDFYKNGEVVARITNWKYTEGRRQKLKYTNTFILKAPKEEWGIQTSEEIIENIGRFEVAGAQYSIVHFWFSFSCDYPTF